jgi:FMN-dependent oxidoreductase (nitrilotriacetate monooxygenase family)
MEHALRYERAREFLQVATGLWDSWEDDAFVRDKESGLYFEPEKLHVLNHKGKHFSERGPLNVARPPQGYPVIVQAGASDDGQDFAASTAEVVFTAQQTLAEAQTFYNGLKGRLATYGRSPEDLKIMPGVFPVIGKTEAEAKEKYDQLQNLIHPRVGLALLSGNLGGFDLSAYPLDDPLPDLPETNLNKSRQKLVTDLARRENLTIRQLYQAIAGARGHRTILGVHRRRSPINWRNGIPWTQPMASTLCPPTCPLDWMTLWSWCFPSSGSEASSAVSTRARPYARILASLVPPTNLAQSQPPQPPA